MARKKKVSARRTPKKKPASRPKIKARRTGRKAIPKPKAKAAQKKKTLMRRAAKPKIKPKPSKAGKAAKKPAPAKPRQPILIKESQQNVMISSPPSVPLLPPVSSIPLVEAAPPPLQPAPASPNPPISGSNPVIPAIEMLPDWEDRLRLKRVIFEDGLEFFSLGKGAEDFSPAYVMLNRSGKKSHSDLHDHFMICAKDRSGRMVGAIDGNALSENLVVLNRSVAEGSKKREIHALLYAAALAGRKPAYVACYTKLGEFSVDLAGRLIFFGRAWGMSAIPLKTSHIIFVRRVKKELDPLSDGGEIASLLSQLKELGELELETHISEFKEKGPVALILLPTSPDSREHLHELRDLVSSLGIAPDQLEDVMISLRSDYVSSRKDITPEVL
ncbi:MAG: hypothetical protein U0R44_03530 [Candidatus Micrarchaeia archaeon]